MIIYKWMQHFGDDVNDNNGFFITMIEKILTGWFLVLSVSSIILFLYLF